MSEWKEYKLGEVACVNPIEKLPKGSLAKKVAMEKLNPFTKIISGFEIDAYNGGAKFRNGDTIVARITPCLENGKTAYINFLENGEVGFGSTEYIVLREKKGVTDRQFLYYFAISDNFRDVAIMSMTGSSGRQRVETDVVKKHLFLLPPIEEQGRIAEILSSLDDKIDLLNRQNSTLEAMAETLFRHHFIENPKEAWKDGVIGDIAKHSKTTIHPQKQPAELFCHYSIPSFDNAKTPTLDLGIDIQSNKYKVQSNSILFSKLNPHKDKRVWLLPGAVLNNSICSTEFQIITPTNNEYLYFLYGWLMHSENYNEIASGVGGTSGSHQRIAPATIFSFACPIIDIDYIKLYNSQAKLLFEKQINNHEQIRTLTKLRDTLLPKLMNNGIKK